jgi:integrase-like protein
VSPTPHKEWRHTFCSHLAMRGAPARAIQELAGHQDLGTTQRYMHLSPAALDAAIRLLETGTETVRTAASRRSTSIAGSTAGWWPMAMVLATIVPSSI